VVMYGSGQSLRYDGLCRILGEWDDYPKKQRQPADLQFKTWLNQVEEGLKRLRDLPPIPKTQFRPVRYKCIRVVLLQHRLIDLVETLDPNHTETYHRERIRSELALDQEIHCLCRVCTIRRRNLVMQQDDNGHPSGPRSSPYTPQSQNLGRSGPRWLSV
jgi:hypothetical protein